MSHSSPFVYRSVIYPVLVFRSIIPSEDAHQSEYIASADARREYISNFTGSAGVAVVSLTTAHLFVDSRYWIQAEREIDTNWTLHKVGAPEGKTWLQWIKQDAEPGSLVGADSRLISCREFLGVYYVFW